MLDWLGMSPQATEIVGWILVAFAVVLLVLLIWYLVKAVPEMKKDTKNIEKVERSVSDLEELEVNKKIQDKSVAKKQKPKTPQRSKLSTQIKKKSTKPATEAVKKTTSKSTKTSAEKQNNE